MKYLLDTHTWIWWHMKPQNLSKKVISLIQDTKRYEELLISAISPWEFCKLIEKGKLGVTLSPMQWILDALDIAGLRLIPLSPLIAYKSTTLPELVSRDPADQIIIATAIEEDAIILTRDQKMQEYTHVHTLW